MLLINKTYATITEESAESGDYAESGFLIEDDPVSFRELVRIMSEYCEASQWPNDGNTGVWLSKHETDYITGDETEESLHYSHNNPEKNAKYWRKAMIAAGLKVSK